MAQRTLIGTFVRRIDDSTIKVEVERKYAHPKYGKIIKDNKFYLVNAPVKEEFEIGDQLEIGEIKPMSKRKYFEYLNKVEIT